MKKNAKVSAALVSRLLLDEWKARDRCPDYAAFIAKNASRHESSRWYGYHLASKDIKRHAR